MNRVLHLSRWQRGVPDSRQIAPEARSTKSIAEIVRRTSPVALVKVLQSLPAHNVTAIMHAPGLRVSIFTTAMLALAYRAVPAVSSDERDVPLAPATRLIVFAPHPDDEALGAAGLIQRVIAGGGAVRIVLMTSGDAFAEGVETTEHIRRPTPRDFRNYGTVRERETIAGMQLLGVNRAHVLFLGFPDGGLCLIASKYLSAKARPFESPYTGRVEPPAPEQVIRGVTYRGADIRREIESILIAYQPTLITLPHPDDRHPDHCATSIFVREALDAIARRHALAPRILYYLIHYEQWPNLVEDVGSPLSPPSGFPPSEGQWQRLTLTGDQTALKQRVIASYTSQMQVIGRFLRAFGRPNELFLGEPLGSPPECWCDATHVATEVRPEQYRRHPPAHP